MLRTREEQFFLEVRQILFPQQISPYILAYSRTQDQLAVENSCEYEMAVNVITDNEKDGWEHQFNLPFIWEVSACICPQAICGFVRVSPDTLKQITEFMRLWWLWRVCATCKQLYKSLIVGWRLRHAEHLRYMTIIGTNVINDMEEEDKDWWEYSLGRDRSEWRYDTYDRRRLTHG